MKVWNWEGFWGYFTNLYLLEGALWTIGLTISTLVLGGLIGLLLAVMRLSKHKALSRTSQGYVWIFRGTPLLVQLIIIYTGLPQLGLVRFTVLESAVIGLALNEAAYLSEILRGGILSVAKGQTEAARALGLRPYQIFRKVMLPQALRVIIPPLGNSVNGLLEDHLDRLGDLHGGGAAARPDPDAAEVPGARSLHGRGHHLPGDDHLLGLRAAPHRGLLRQGLRRRRRPAAGAG